MTYPVSKKIALLSAPKRRLGGGSRDETNAHGEEMEAFYASQVPYTVLGCLMLRIVLKRVSAFCFL